MYKVVKKGVSNLNPLAPHDACLSFCLISSFNLANLPSTHVFCQASIFPPSITHLSGSNKIIPLAITVPALSKIFSPI